MLDAYRIQASAGSVTDKALEEIIFRASHGVLRSLVNYYAGLKGRVATQRRAHPADDLPRGRGDNGRPVVTPLFYVFALGSSWPAVPRWSPSQRRAAPKRSGDKWTTSAFERRRMRTHASVRVGSMKHVSGRMVGPLVKTRPGRPDGLMNTSLEGGTMATYHVVAIIDSGRK
jgi:hypothetical protein